MSEACGTGCGCAEESAAPLGEPAAPVACSLSVSDRSSRVAGWHHLLETVTARDPIDGGVRLVLGPDAPVGALAELAVAEQACCAFMAFAVVIDDRGIALEVTAPPEGRDVLTRLFGPLSDSSASETRGTPSS